MKDEGQELQTLSGRVVHITFRNEENFYTVLRIRPVEETGKTVTGVGILPEVQEGISYDFQGTYVEHPRYGLQFQIAGMQRLLPSEQDGIIRYLSGPSFPGIGPSTARRIVEVLGEDCLRKIRNDPAILSQVPGLSDERRQTIADGVAREQDGMQELVRFLNVHGIGMRNLIRLNRTYGRDAWEKLQENPYRVIEECEGFGFKTADEMAMSLGFALDDERRLYALLVSLCMDLCMRDGDSYVLLENLQKAFDQACAGLTYSFDDLLDKACSRRSLVKEEDRIYPVSQFDAEMLSAAVLTDGGRTHRQKAEVAAEELEKGIARLEESFSITYDDQQKEAIRALFSSPFLILTGGPGTGKTTVVKAMVYLYRQLFPESTVLCTAPTGRAAKRLSEISDMHSTTIHSLLKWDLESNTFGRGREDPIQADVLIVDEFSMVDTYLFAHLLDACRNVGHICVIGDEDQLPSVSPGSVLRDLIDSGLFPLIRLQHIYRQKEGSDVIALAHAIHEGSVDFADYTHDVVFLEYPQIPIRDQVLQIVQHALEQGWNMNEIQVLSPMYSGNAGIDLLNNALQEAFNPPEKGKREIHSGYRTFRVGDKILQLRNQPDDDVYNGDIGTLVEIALASETENHAPALVVDFDGIYVEYGPDSFPNITLAYCISIHKSQGSEYPIVIIPFTRRQSFMLQRNLIYTGVTRARQSLILLGEKEAFLKGIQVVSRHERQTTLKKRLLDEDAFWNTDSFGQTE